MRRADPARILVVEDDEALSEVTCEALRERGHTVVAALRAAEGIDRLAEADFDVAILDLQLPDGNGIEILKRIREDDLDTEVIILTGYAAISTAIEAMRKGAYDYLSKPAPLGELEVVVERATEKARLRRENATLRVRVGQRDAVRGLTTKDPGMDKLLKTLGRAAASELPILIQGESGTGKELLARAVHDQSPRATQPFVAINCAAVPETIIESELFGHERGAFTGATEKKPGLFEAAARGVLFLDEIGDVSASLQAKLLRVLETKEFFRVGGTRVVRSDVRIVSATNKDLLEEIEAGRFREDLYYRLNGVTFALPPLRERPGDIGLLARQFLDRAGGGKLLSARSLEALERYDWPGNVRELQMVIQRANLLCNGDTIEPDSLPLEGARRRPGRAMRTDLTLAEMETQYIKTVLERNKGQRAKTARALGIDPKTLYNKLRAIGKAVTGD